MLLPRIIPVLLLNNRQLVKTRQFKEPRYIGDPINAARIFEGFQADEMCVLDIGAGLRGIDFDYIERMSYELFSPLCYGGGIRNLADAKRLFGLGVEKVALNTAAINKSHLLTDIAQAFGSQAVVASIDATMGPQGDYRAMLRGKRTGLKVEYLAQECVGFGAGEILLQSVDRDGMMNGYDLDLIKLVSGAVSVPVIACSGARSVEDFSLAVDAGASAVSAGSIFVFHKERGDTVLISYPEREGRGLDGVR